MFQQAVTEQRLSQYFRPIGFGFKDPEKAGDVDTHSTLAYSMRPFTISLFVLILLLPKAGNIVRGQSGPVLEFRRSGCCALKKPRIFTADFSQNTAAQKREESQTDEELKSKRKQLLGNIIVLDTKYRELRSEPYNESTEQDRERSVRATFEQLQNAQQEYERVRSPSDKNAEQYVRLAGTTREQFDPYWRSLTTEVTLLHYFIASDETTAFIITRRNIQITKWSVNEKEIAHHLKEFFELARDNESQAPLEPLQNLYKVLVSPIQEKLTQNKVIGIIPGEKLQGLPFAALTADRTVFLGDQHALFYLPNASMLSLLENRHVQPRKLLAVVPDPIRGKPFLASASKDTAELSSKYDVRVLKEATATKTEFLAHANSESYDIIHFATHSECNRVAAGLSRLLLNPDPADGNDVSLRIDDIKELNLRGVDLVVLSACESHACGEYQAEVINSFDRAFFTARVSSVIGSLWEVRDDPTGYLMTRFYAHLSEGVSKVDALSKAQQDARIKYSNPYHWAAFILIGNPGLKN